MIFFSEIYNRIIEGTMRDFTLIYGCMFAGKTTRLIGLYNESLVDINDRLVVKPLLDNRYQANKINSHGGLQIMGHRISKAEEIFPLIQPNIKECYIDEVQFFGPYIVTAIGELMINGIRVIAAGLDRDYLHRDFGSMGELKKLATDRVILHAKCQVCQKEATHTYRTLESADLVVVGHNDAYQARCETHWKEGMLQQNPSF
jgi:thymidine kinase